MFHEIRFPYRCLAIDPQLTAPLLGYRSTLPGDILALVEEVMEEAAGCFDIRGGYQVFDQIICNDEAASVRIAGMDFNMQKTVYHQLKHSSRMAVFVCTAGAGIGQWSKQMMAANEPLKGFVADILGSVVVEAAMDAVQQRLADDMQQAGLKITNRYSPGYCGWPTQEQHKLFALFPSGNCGVHLTASALMHPVKSISGFIGIGANVRFHPYTCSLCDATSCVYRHKKMSRILSKQPVPIR